MLPKTAVPVNPVEITVYQRCIPGAIFLFRAVKEIRKDYIVPKLFSVSKIIPGFFLRQPVKQQPGGISHPEKGGIPAAEISTVFRYLQCSLFPGLCVGHDIYSPSFL